MSSCSRNSLVLPCSAPSWSRCLDRMVELLFEYSMTVPVRWQYLAGMGQWSPEGCMKSESVSDIWYCFSHHQNSQVQESMVGKGTCIIYHPPKWPTNKNFSYCPHELMVYWSESLSSTGRNISTRRHNHYSIELEVKTPVQPLWAPKTSGKELLC